MKKTKKYLNFKVIFILLLSILIIPFAFTLSSIQADEINSSVLTDLHKDSSFNEEDYVYDAKDYSIQFLQIAESVDNELNVYTYQPCAIEYMQATSINMAISLENDAEFKNYKLTYLGNDGVFFKYIVNDFVVKNVDVRYYKISSIYRNYYEIIDGKQPEDKTINEVVFEVGKIFTAYTENNVVKYECSDIETIQILDKVVGYVRMVNGGLPTLVSTTDSHFVAFSTDKEIDKLLEASVSFVTRDIKNNGFSTSYGQSIERKADLKYTDVVTNDVKYWFGHKYEWNTIEDVETFIVPDKDKLISSNNVEEDILEKIKEKQWVLRFFDSENQIEMQNHTWTEVTEVTVLSLKFETDGIVYNLGTIDNKETGYLVSTDKSAGKIWTYLGTGLIIILLILSIIFFPQVYVLIFKILFQVISLIL